MLTIVITTLKEKNQTYFAQFYNVKESLKTFVEMESGQDQPQIRIDFSLLKLLPAKFLLNLSTSLQVIVQTDKPTCLKK